MEIVSSEKMKSAFFTSEEITMEPELTEFFSRFAFDETPQSVSLSPADAYLGVLAALMGCQGLEAFRRMAKSLVSGPLKDAALKPVQMREMAYQGTAYLGIGRSLPFIDALEDILKEAGISLRVLKTGTVTADTRREKGSEKQVEIFGPQMKDFASSGPEDSRHINEWLVDNCFGDYYTRRGLTARQREMITFCFLAGQGGCEPQLLSHIAGNFRVGNDAGYLIGVISVCLPYIGYPRSLNALRCVREVQQKQSE